tara:strand:- start:5562 stop:6107 length:546 start_codon:yes stop_codon:yes gene_type:complete
MKTPKLKIESRPIAALTHDPDNARARGPRAVEAIANSLKRFGQQKPIVVSESGVVIAGNGTLAAAKQLGWTDVAVHVTTLAGLEQRAFALADNRTAELAYWNETRLGAVLAQLSESDDDELRASTGFSASEMEALAKAMRAEDEDEPDTHREDDEEKGVSTNLALETPEPDHTCPKCGFRF